MKNDNISSSNMDSNDVNMDRFTVLNFFNIDGQLSVESRN